MSLICSRNNGNGKTTLEKGGRDPPDVTLDKIAEDLLAFLKGFEHLNKPEENIKKKYDIKQEHEHNCWPEDDIKRAWGKSKRMGINSAERKDWSAVILSQMLKRSFVCGECKLQAAQENRHATTAEQGCETTPSLKGNSKDRSSQSNAELGTVGAVGGVKNHTTNSVQPYSVSQGQTGTHFPGRSQVTGNLPGAADGQDRPGVALHNEGIHGPTYIRIPVSHMSSNRSLFEVPEQSVPEQPVPEQGIHYKFINRSPSALIDDNLRRDLYYVMSFNDETNNAEWVYEILNRQTLAVNYLTNEGEFGYPYHRGHLARAANHRWCQEAQTHANLINNIVPQHWTLNLGPWKRAEHRCRDLTNEDGIRNVHVYSGPIYQCRYPQWIKDKAVPNHFFKVIIVENENGTVREPECYLMPNEDVRPYQTLRYYWRTINQIEEVSGLTFIERTNVRGNDGTVMMTMVGQDGKKVQRTAEIQVKMRV